MREEAPVDDVEPMASINDINDGLSSQDKLIQDLNQQISNVIDQNKLLRKENCDLRSDLRLEVAAYDARKAEIENTLEAEIEKMNEEKRKFDEEIASLEKENQRLKDSMIPRSEARVQMEKANVEIQAAQGKIDNLEKENGGLKACITDLQKSLDMEKEAKEILNQETERAANKSKQKLEKIRNELLHQINQYMKQLDELNDRHEDDVKAKAKLEVKILNITASHEAERKEIKDKFDEELAMVTSLHEKKHDDMKIYFEEQIYDLSTKNMVVLF